MYFCGLAKVAILSLIATKLAVRDCSGFHVFGSGFLVPSCLITVRVVIPQSCVFASLVVCWLVKVQG